MILEITSRSSIGPDAKPYLSSGGLTVIVHSGNSTFGHVVEESQRWAYATTRPILGRAGSLFRDTKAIFQREDLDELQNEVSGISVRASGNDLRLLMYSARMSRSRLFFLVGKESIYLSGDLRDLLRFSAKQVQPEIIYGILKFGETPEYDTPVSDIKAVPVGCSIEVDGKGIQEAIKRGRIDMEAFRPYHQVRYVETGGDPAVTEGLLKDILSHLHRLRPGLLVSGGTDSSLLNYLYNEVSEESYPAFFFDFKTSPIERQFVDHSLKGTKGELVPVLIHSDNLLENFLRSVEKLIYPVYDAGSALVGHIFSTTVQKEFGTDLSLIDGTVADSCYGVRDYRYPLKSGGRQPTAYSLLKEWLYGKAELSGLVRSGVRPRDSFLTDEFLQDLLWYGGVYANLWFTHAQQYTRSLVNRYAWYLNMLHPENRGAYWPRYTITKMMLYAARQTTVKAYDMLLPNQVYFPFMFKTILDDQGKYTWLEKAAGGVIKAPLKKLLEGYAPTEFVYRKKMGLQSRTKLWINDPAFRSYADAVTFRKDSIACAMMRANAGKLRRAYHLQNPPGAILSLVLSLTVIQYWMDIHGLKLDR